MLTSILSCDILNVKIPGVPIINLVLGKPLQSITVFATVSVFAFVLPPRDQFIGILICIGIGFVATTIVKINDIMAIARILTAYIVKAIGFIAGIPAAAPKTKGNLQQTSFGFNKHLIFSFQNWPVRYLYCGYSVHHLYA